MGNKYVNQDVPVNQSDMLETKYLNQNEDELVTPENHIENNVENNVSNKIDENVGNFVNFYEDHVPENNDNHIVSKHVTDANMSKMYVKKSKNKA